MPSKTTNLRTHELRAIYLLIGECGELGGDPYAWRIHMLERLRTIFGSTLAFCGELLPPRPQHDEAWRQRVLDVGFGSHRDREGYRRWAEQNAPQINPFAEPMLREVTTGKAIASVRLRRDVVPDSEWYRSEFFHDYMRPCHIDDGIISIDARRPGPIEMLSVTRSSSDVPFEERDRRLMRLFHVDVIRLRGSKLTAFDEPSITELPLRQRQVLLCLLEGDAEDQAASRLGISRHTLHEHVKRLHRRFGAASRGELFARARRLIPALERDLGEESTRTDPGPIVAEYRHGV